MNAAKVARREEQMRFLDELRRGGSVNMFGAAPVLQRAFGITRHEAKAAVSEWMRTFAQRSAK